MKRFYTNVSVDAAEDGFSIQLDGRPVKTPAKNPLCLPNRLLADAVAGEWQSQEAEIVPATMPLTRLANSAVDRVAVHRNAVIDEIAGYGTTDLLCYRVDGPEELRRRQDDDWDPLLAWLREERGIALTVTDGLLPVTQGESDMSSIRECVAGYDAFVLAGLHAVTTGSGSVVLGLATAAGRIDGNQAWTYSLLEETWQIEEWGEDAEATARRENLRVDLEAAGAFLALLRDGR